MLRGWYGGRCWVMRCDVLESVYRVEVVPYIHVPTKYLLYLPTNLRRNLQQVVRYSNSNLSNMQFSLLTLVAAALAATASANYNGTTYYPTGTGSASVKPTGTGVSPTKTSLPPFTGAATMPTGGAALGLLVAGGVAMVS
jgi:hypothetical protein